MAPIKAMVERGIYDVKCEVCCSMPCSGQWCGVCMLYVHDRQTDRQTDRVYLIGRRADSLHVNSSYIVWTSRSVDMHIWRE